MHHGQKNGGDAQNKEEQDCFIDYFCRDHGLWLGKLRIFWTRKIKSARKVMYRLDYRCFGADLQGQNEGDCILDSKKLINNKKRNE
jgi:hypothetical protein